MLVSVACWCFIKQPADLMFDWKNAATTTAAAATILWILSLQLRRSILQGLFRLTYLRPISLLPVLAKILESFVVNWLRDVLAPALHHNQFDCLKGHYTSHALMSFYSFLVSDFG